MSDLVILILINILMFTGIYTITGNNLTLTIFIWVLLTIIINTDYLEKEE